MRGKKITAELLFSWYFSSIEPVTFMLVWFWIVFVFGLGKEKGFESISARMLLVRLCQWNWDGEGEGGWKQCFHGSLIEQQLFELCIKVLFQCFHRKPYVMILLPHRMPLWSSMNRKLPAVISKSFSRILQCENRHHGDTSVFANVVYCRAKCKIYESMQSQAALLGTP